MKLKRYGVLADPGSYSGLLGGNHAKSSVFGTLILIRLLNLILLNHCRSPVCLPRAIVRSICLPFVCPVYSLQSRHPSDQPDFLPLTQYIEYARVLPTLSSERTRIISVAVIRALRALWHSCLEGLNILTMYVPYLPSLYSSQYFPDFVL